MRTILKSIVFALALTSCVHNTQKIPQHSASYYQDSSRKASTTPISPSADDTLIVDGKAAIFIQPDSQEIETRKRSMGEENFDKNAEDSFYYMGTAHIFLDSVKVRAIDTRAQKFVKFISHDKTQCLIRLDTLHELWSLYLFDPDKKVKQANMAIIGEEYRSYFRPGESNHFK